MQRNKKVYICSIAAPTALLLTMLAASPMRAADRTAAIPPRASDGKLSVVRVDRRTGKLMRAVTAPLAPSSAAAGRTPNNSRFSEIVNRSARAHDIDPLLVQSVIQVESNNNPYAVSPKGAEGLMQLMPRTSRMLGVSNSFDPVENIEAGVKYLKYLQSVYKDDRLALAAYNAGPGAVEKYNQVPPYPETQNYVNQVGRRYDAARQAQQKADAVERPVSDPAAAPPPKVPRLEQFIDENGGLHFRTLLE